jgi:serine/threonine protein kinase
MDANDEPKLADFGSSVSQEIIRNTFCGTYEYMAPEIYMRKKQTAKVDSWALGVLLYEMTHNNTPFKNKDVMQIKEIVENDRIKFDDQISNKIRNIIRNILKFNDKERPTTAQILKFPELKRFYQEMKPDLLLMYQNNKIAKLRKIKSVNNEFKTEKQYRHMQTTTNLDNVENKNKDMKKQSNELKRFSKDITQQMIKNNLTDDKGVSKENSASKPCSSKANPIACTSITELPEEDRGLNMRPNQMKDPFNEYKVSIHNDKVDKDRTSYEMITDIINDVPKQAPPTFLPESKLFKNQFMTSQYTKSNSGKKKIRSISKKSKKNYNSDKKPNKYQRKLDNDKLQIFEALTKVKLNSQRNPSNQRKIKKNENFRSITNKIRSLFDKSKITPKTPNMKSGLYRLNSDSNYHLSAFKKAKFSKSKSKNFTSVKNSKLSDKESKKSNLVEKQIYNTNAKRNEEFKDLSVTSRNRKKNFKVDSKHFKDFEKKFALKIGFNPYNHKKKSKSQRELQPISSVTHIKQTCKTRHSGIGASLVSPITPSSIMNKMGNLNHLPNSSKKRQLFSGSKKNKKIISNFSHSNSKAKDIYGKKMNNGLNGVLEFSYSKNLYSKLKTKKNPKNNFSQLLLSNKNIKNNYCSNIKSQIIPKKNSSSNRNSSKRNINTKSNRGKSNLSKFDSQKSSTKHSAKSKNIDFKNKNLKEGKDSTNDPDSAKYKTSKKYKDKYPVSFSALKKNFSLIGDFSSSRKEIKSRDEFGMRFGKGLSTEDLFRPDNEKGYFSNNFY